MSQRWSVGLAILGVGAAAWLGGRYFAHASAGGSTQNTLTFAGTLTGTTGSQSLTFVFKKGSSTACSPQVTVTPAASGAFHADIPLDACPRSLFDGSDVTVDVQVGATTVVSGQSVNPVPYAKYADQVGSPDCPVGYDRDATAAMIVLCKRGSDEVVRVGTGITAFWIDRYESSVWDARGGAQQFFKTDADFNPTSFPVNGQWTAPLFAESRSGVTPAAHITWFQANEACAASGKRLPSGDEWLRAARGTPDPVAPSDGSAGTCNTSGGTVRAAGGGVACASAWGAQDMIGNVGEWTAEWFPGVGDSSPSAAWPTGFGGDGTNNVASTTIGTGVGLPSAVVRGGDGLSGPQSGVRAGVFAFNLNVAPTLSAFNISFRCVIPR